MTELKLTGLDGSNPLAFFAALGVLNVLSDVAGEGEMPTLRWEYEGAWRPVVKWGGEGDPIQGLVQLLEADRKTWKKEPVIQLEYGKQQRDLKPPPEIFRGFLLGLRSKAAAGDRRSVDFAAAFATGIAVDNNRNTKPTALHFTAGQQAFLAMVIELAEKVTPDDLEEAVIGPWTYSRDLPVLRWDATSSRDYALRATDPSKDAANGVPGADWLAFRGLSLIPTAPSGTQILTTGCFGGWKTGGFRWALTTAAVGRDSTRSVLMNDSIPEMAESERRARGIGVVFESRIRRSDQGGYGSFSPAQVI